MAPDVVTVEQFTGGLGESYVQSARTALCAPRLCPVTGGLFVSLADVERVDVKVADAARERAVVGSHDHGDLPPGNPAGAVGARITGVVDWAAASWGPADLDVAHCSTSLALLHGPAWGLRFTEAYQEAGGTPAAAAAERLDAYVTALMDALG